MYEIYRSMYEALGIKDIDKILLKPDQPTPKDPALEHIDALAGKPFQAFPGQDHRAHVTTHLSFMSTNLAKNAPAIMASLEKNVFEHISLMGQEQVDPDSVAIGAPTAVTVTLNEYGNAVLTTRKLQLMSLAEVDPAIANIVAFNMADSIDEIVQTELRAGTNVIYASNASGTSPPFHCSIKNLMSSGLK